MLGLGWPEWLTIIGLVGGLLLTFKVMARASLSYEKARQRREAMAGGERERPQPPQHLEETREDERQ